MNKLFISLVLSLMISPALAGEISFCNVCDNLKLSQKGDDLLILCPPSTVPVMTYKNCPNAKAKKVNGQIVLTCGNSNKVMPITPKASTKLDAPAN